MGKALLALAICAFVTLSTQPALACLNGVIMEESEAAQNVKLAETALLNGRNSKALHLLRADHYMIESHALMKRVTLLKAVANLRSGKAKRAERVFRRMLRKDKDNPFLQARLAEALHKRKGESAVEAWKIMHDLETRDLVPDAHGYAVLARLRKRANDTKGHQRALDQCRVMAGKRAALCS